MKMQVSCESWGLNSQSVNIYTVNIKVKCKYGDSSGFPSSSENKAKILKHMARTHSLLDRRQRGIETDL